jgi:hypothetical protein
MTEDARVPECAGMSLEAGRRARTLGKIEPMGDTMEEAEAAIRSNESVAPSLRAHNCSRPSIGASSPHGARPKTSFVRIAIFLGI